MEYMTSPLVDLAATFTHKFLSLRALHFIYTLEAE